MTAEAYREVIAVPPRDRRRESRSGYSKVRLRGAIAQILMSSPRADVERCQGVRNGLIARTAPYVRPSSKASVYSVSRPWTSAYAHMCASNQES